MLLLTLPGTLTMYYREEISMVNVPIPAAMVQDRAEANQPGIGMGRRSRANSDAMGCHCIADFIEGQPWLPLGDHELINVTMQQADECSILNLYVRLIALRRMYPILADGEIHSIAAEGNLLRYERAKERERILVLLNLGPDPMRTHTKSGTIMESTYLHRRGEELDQSVELRSSEGIVIKLTH
jgi:alpha-glucosidase